MSPCQCRVHLQNSVPYYGAYRLRSNVFGASAVGEDLDSEEAAKVIALGQPLRLLRFRKRRSIIYYYIHQQNSFLISSIQASLADNFFVL